MWEDKSSIKTKFLNQMILIVFVSIGLWCLIWIHGEYSTFRAESANLREEHILSQKILLKKEVSEVVTYIRDMRRQSEEKLETELKERVYQAHKIAMNIYQQNSSSKDLFEIQKMIKDALRPIRFNDGQGYFFAVSMDGVEQLYPVKPEFEGKNLMGLQDSKGSFVIQEEIEIIKAKEEGFVKDFWTKPGKDPSKLYSKISFIKYFKPLNWYFGTGEYLDDAKNQIQGEILNRIANLRFGTEGYFFGSTYQGDSLFSNGKIAMGSGSIWDLTDPNGVKIIQEQRKAVENPEGGFVYYSWNKLNTSVPSPKISFVQGIFEWGWTIGAGAYLDTIEKTISGNRTALIIGLKKRIAKSLMMLAVLLCLTYFWSRRISGQIQKSVDTFTSFLSKSSIESTRINPDEIQLKEFRDIAISTNKMLEDRKQAQKDLRASEALLNTTQRLTKVGGWEWDVESQNMFWTDEVYRIHGFVPGQIPKGSSKHMEQSIDCYTPQDKTVIMEAFKNCIEKGQAYDLEFAFTSIKGRHLWIRTIAEPIFEKGTVVKVIGNIMDITERKEAEEAIRRSESILNSTQQLAKIGGWEIDLKTQNLFWTDEVYRIHDLKPDSFLSDKKIETDPSTHHKPVEAPSIDEAVKLSMACYDPEDRKLISDAYKKCVQKGQAYDLEFPFTTTKGRRIWIRTITKPIMEDGHVIKIVGNFMDITERKQIEEQLHQTQKMESIGTLAGGIAHDFNNILFPIVGHTELLIEDLPDDSPFQNNLNEIYKGALRARDLVRQILTFSRQEKSKLKLMRLAPVIKEALKLIRSTIPTTIEIRQDIQTDGDVIKADPTQIHQVIMNLTTNAYHAMEETGGELTVSLKNIKLSKHDLINPDMKPGYYSCLTVEDTGVGMRNDVRDKIFDPFFTTKEKGKGTGMGLSVVHGIVNKMGGAIQVYSKPGEGTRFNIYFPIEKTFSKKEDIPQTREILHTGKEHILLVDDEEGIITMEKQILERLGYQVTSRTSSMEALEAFKDHPDKFDLIVTDMAMPNMAGDKLSAEIVKIRPDIPILLCTGFSETMSMKKAASLGIKGFLMKPVMMKDLSQKIHELLEKKEKMT